MERTVNYNSLNNILLSLISNFRRVLYVVCFLLGTISYPSSFYSHLPAYEDGTDRVFRNVDI